jgi:aryl-alcohol dehydrogenase-like predicted oxidoreductase
VERELTPMARAFNLPVCAWGAVGGGVLTGKHTRGGTPDAKRDTTARRSERNLAIARAVDAVADELGTTSTRVAIAWLQHQPGAVIPIVGARTAAQLDDAIGAADVTLPAEALAKLDAASAVELGFPHQFLQLPYVRKLVGGDTVDRLALDPHRPRV